MYDTAFATLAFAVGSAFILGLGIARLFSPRPPTVVYMPVAQDDARQNGAGCTMVLAAVAALLVILALMRTA